MQSVSIEYGGRAAVEIPAGRPGPRTAAHPGGGLELRLLGDFRLRLGDATVGLTPRAEHLLAFLALRTGLTRAAVSAQLWPVLDEGQARGCLRTTLWRLPRPGGLPPHDDGRVQVDHYQRTSVPSVFAAGDVARTASVAQNMSVSAAVAGGVTAMSWCASPCRRARRHRPGPDRRPGHGAEGLFRPLRVASTAYGEAPFGDLLTRDVQLDAHAGGDAPTGAGARRSYCLSWFSPSRPLRRSELARSWHGPRARHRSVTRAHRRPRPPCCRDAGVTAARQTSIECIRPAGRMVASTQDTTVVAWIRPLDGGRQ